MTVLAGVSIGQQKPAIDKPVTNQAIAKPAQADVSGTSNLSNPESPQNLPVTYTFTGDGLWSDQSQWNNNLKPPPTTTATSKIIINHIAGGQCRLDIPYIVTPGTDLIILPGKTLIVPSLVVN